MQRVRPAPNAPRQKRVQSRRPVSPRSWLLRGAWLGGGLGNGLYRWIEIECVSFFTLLAGRNLRVNLSKTTRLSARQFQFCLYCLQKRPKRDRTGLRERLQAIYF